MIKIAKTRHTSVEVIKHEEESQKADSPEPLKNDPYGCDNPDALQIKASSATDCTGLIPALPESKAELEAYAQMYHIPADVLEE